MAIVFTIAQQKGGAGKTTLAANLAALLCATRRVALLDIDPQRSLTRWFALRGAPKPGLPAITFSDVAGWRLAAELDRLRAAHDVVIIDSPPQIDTEARQAIRAASLVLAPVQPSPVDMWAAEGTLRLAEAENRKVALILNRAPASSRLRSDVERMCAERKLTLLGTSLGNRTAFAIAFAMGLGVHEYAPRSLAATELRSLAAELVPGR
jgi:chromosome partitioning protein